MYDLVITGAGINGAGVAQAAAAAGYRVLVIERNDQPGLETSSSSSKLIHGGLRYLESFQFALVREALQERELLLQLAPELVRMRFFNIPVYHDTRRSSARIAAGLWLYYLLAGRKEHHRFQRINRSFWPQLEGLKLDRLQAVYRYQDAQTDDAQLARAVLASAVDLGAECRCNTELLSARKTAQGLSLGISQGNTQATLECRVLVNAAGPWVSPVNERISTFHDIGQLKLVEGAHLVLDRPVQQAYYLESPQDGRAVFLLPWKGSSLLGTTETLVDQPSSKPKVSDADRRYLLEIYRHFFPGSEPTVLQEMAGCRVLPQSVGTLFHASREVLIDVDDESSPRVVTMIGGKLTVYRRSAIKVMQFASKSLPPSKTVADTARLRLRPVDESRRF